MAIAEALRDGFRRDPLTTATAAFLGAVCVMAVLGPMLAVHDPYTTDAARSLRPPSWSTPCGTDQVGRDICTRILYATRLDLFIAVSAVVIAMLVGSVLGSLAGYFGGWIDRLTMWLIDTIMAFPLFVLAMGIVAALGSSMENIIYATAIVNVPFYARTVRAEINQRREAGFVEAARIAGNGPFRVLIYHLFPTAIPQLAVQMTLTMGWAMLNAASLSFIGLGIRPPTPEWGIMVAEGASFIITGEWWVALFPGIALVLVVLSLNLLGDGLRDMIDARERR
ncbi:MAG: ABC transporter permease [Hyphomicrobiales bacterium]|nr:MAG: ABC transporter permease [Hyphomicrobiales bacterium]